LGIWHRKCKKVDKYYIARKMEIGEYFKNPVNFLEKYNAKNEKVDMIYGYLTAVILK